MSADTELPKLRSCPPRSYGHQSIYLFLTMPFGINLLHKDKTTIRKANYLCYTSRWTKRLRGVLTHSCTHKWKTQICFDNLLYYKNIYECKLQQSCIHLPKAHIPRKRLLRCEEGENTPSKLTALGLRRKPPVFYDQDFSSCRSFHRTLMFLTSMVK